MSDVLNIGLIGCGGMMGAHRDGYKRLYEAGTRAFRIAACCDINQESAEKMAAEIAAWQTEKPKVYADFRKMLDTEQSLEAVDISVLHKEHHAVAIPCLQAGKHVTIEKPLALTLRAGLRIIEAAEKAGVVLQVAENYRRASDMRAVRWAIDQGMLGDLRTVFWTDVQERLWYWGWRDHVELAGGGWSMDGGVHFADMFRYFIGPVDELYAVSRAYSPVRYGKHETMEDPIPATVEDTTMAVLKFENGVVGQWDSTIAAPGTNFSARALCGSAAAYRWDEGLVHRDGKLTPGELTEKFMATISPADKERLFPQGVADPVACELAEFIRAVTTGSQVETDGWEGYRAEAISLAVYESSEIGAPVKMKDVEDLRLEGYQKRLNEMYGIE